MQVGWKDNTAVLGISTVLTQNETVDRLRHKPKATSTSAKTARASYGPDEYTKTMPIPLFWDLYNHNMNSVDRGDQLAVINAGLRHMARGGWQAIEHWLLRVVLCNCFILAWWAGPDSPREINFRNQQDFCNQLINSLLYISKDIARSKKRRISYISQDAESSLVSITK
jgi:hypothetical protein